MSDHQLLKTVRIVLVLFCGAALVFAVNSKSTMYEMVQNAYKVTLAGAFVPLAFGVYWKKANNAGAAASIFAGMGVWIAAELKLFPTMMAGAEVPPQLFGLLAAIVAMIAVSLATHGKSPSHASAIQ